MYKEINEIYENKLLKMEKLNRLPKQVILIF